MRQVAGQIGKREDIRQVRRTRKGEVLLEIATVGKSGTVIDALRGNLGEGVTARAVVPRVEVEIRDLDPVISKDEVLASFCERVWIPSPGEVRVKVLRPTSWGTQIAVLEVPQRWQRNVTEAGSLRIGMVSVRARVVPSILRCFRCHGLRHISANCKQKEGLCRKCGNPGHDMGECAAPPACRLCSAAGLSGNRVGHIAGSRVCPQFQEALRRKGVPVSN